MYIYVYIQGIGTLPFLFDPDPPLVHHLERGHHPLSGEGRQLPLEHKESGGAAREVGQRLRKDLDAKELWGGGRPAPTMQRPGRNENGAG